MRTTLIGTPTEWGFQLADCLNSYGPKNALIPAAPPISQDRWRIVTEDELAKNPDAIARTKAYFRPIAGPALMLLDYDIKDYPARVKERLLKLERPRLQSAMIDVMPDLDAAAGVFRHSMSVGIRNRLNGKETDVNGGLHQYLFVADGRDISAFAVRLTEHLMLREWAWYYVSDAGVPLPRTLIDLAASTDVGRLSYEGTPILNDDALEYLPEKRRATHRPGGLLDTSMLPELDEHQRARLAEILDAERERVREEAAEKREAWRERTAKRLPAGRRPVPVSVLDKAADHLELQGDFPIPLDDRRTVTPREILAAPMRFHKLTGPDPLEPEYGGGRNKAIIYADGSSVRIESLAHGGQTYFVTPLAEDLFEHTGPRDVFGDGDTLGALRLPQNALPEIVERWAVDTSERIGAPVSFAGLAALTTIAAAIGSKLRIQPKQHDTGWTEFPILWGAIIEEPGGKKSPVIGAATAPLSAIDAKYAQEGVKALAEWSDRKARSRKGDPEMGPKPKIRRHMVESFTMEALTSVLADNPAGVLARQDELTQIVSGLGQYKSGGGSDRQMLLSLADGREMRVDRAGKGLTHVPCWGTWVIGGIQPRKIREQANSLEADGLLQRFIPVWGSGERRRGVDRAPDEAAQRAYWEAVTRLAEAPFVQPKAITLSSEARRHWRLIEDRIEALADLPGLSDAWRGHLGKWPGFSARLFLVSHVIDHLDNLATVDEIEVSGPTAARAARLIDWLLANSLRFYAECIGGGEAGEDARWVAGYILAAKIKGTLTRRDLGQKRNELRDLDRAVRAMRFLEANDWCAADGQRTDKHGPMQWTICPEVHDGRFASRAESEQLRRARERKKIDASVRERRRLLEENGDER